MRARTVLVVAGEASGDDHAARLVVAMRRRDPTLRILAMGGERLRATGATMLHGIDEVAVVGITEVLAHLPRVLRVLSHLKAVLRSGEVDLFVPVDFPDFNFRLARAAHRAGVPVFCFIAPQVWAWRRNRIHEMRRWCAHLGVLFPFEEAFFREAGIPVTYVGHPLVHELRVQRPREEIRRAAGAGAGERLIALLPGSRRSEVRRNLPAMVGALHVLRARNPAVRGVIARAPTLPPETLSEIAPDVPLLDPPAFDVAAAADLALCASGTATVEVCLAETPMVVLYRLSPVSWAIAKRLVRLPHIAMVNLIARERLVPELLQDAAAPEPLAAEAARLLEDEPARERILAGYRRVRDALAGGAGVGVAADRALALIAARGA